MSSTGRIKALRGTYGFITAEDGRDLFFHGSDLLDGDVELGEGDLVSFDEVLPTPERGARASHIVFLKPKES
jgi:cold shock CspA family protein